MPDAAATEEANANAIEEQQEVTPKETETEK
jgi:hypothetical protein